MAAYELVVGARQCCIPGAGTAPAEPTSQITLMCALAKAGISVHHCHSDRREATCKQASLKDTTNKRKKAIERDKCCLTMLSKKARLA